MTQKFDLVILDCDGVLVDSEVISTHTLLETLVAEGLDIDIGHVREHYLGRSTAAVAADYLRLTGRDLPETFEADFLARLVTAYRRDLKAMSGVRELIAAIPCLYCLATSSSLDRAAVSLDITGLLPLFEGRIFSASMVAHGKPAPDLFLHAAETMGADPDRCLVIEDSEVGVLAAQNAGMNVWRFVGGSHFAGAEPQHGHRGVPAFATMQKMAAAFRGDIV
jgi:HAD superfamily hydrolase (TIGR01509 family)